MDMTTCAFTGHRPKSFPWKYNEADPGCVLLKEVLGAQISALADRGVTNWLSGMAQGTDLWAAEAVLSLRKKRSALRLHCILPCKGQENKWNDSEQKRYNSILCQADEIVYVNQAYSPNCMMERNRYLVDQTAILLAIYNGTQRSGTGATVRYARKEGHEIIIIHPISHAITHFPAGNEL